VTTLVRAELLKLRTIRVTYGLLAGAVAMAALGVVAVILTAGDEGGGPPLETAEGVRNVFGNVGSVSILTLVLGILVVTGELRHGTVTQTFLVTPARSRVIGAKVVAMALAGVAFAGMASVVVLAIAVPWLAGEDAAVPLLSGDLLLPLAAGSASTALFAIIGVGVGALIRHQVAAVVTALVWQFVLEGTLVALLPSVGKWLPQGAARALGQETLSDGELLAPWAGGLVLLAYGIASPPSAPGCWSAAT
jgi:ABC-2 type transport system permease protein